jgi:MFS family permease
MQIPSNMLITRIQPGIYMSSWMVVWAGVSAATAAVHNFGGLVACRFFLGITEAPFYPGATYMLSIFYTRKGTPPHSAPSRRALTPLQRSPLASPSCTVPRSLPLVYQDLSLPVSSKA